MMKPEDKGRNNKRASSSSPWAQQQQQQQQPRFTPRSSSIMSNINHNHNHNHNHNIESVPSMAAATASSLSSSLSSSNRILGVEELHFPLKLHILLEEAETLGFDDVIAWMPDGRSFRIFDKDKLEQQVMPRFFSSCKFKSFQRSLNLWKFETAKKNNAYDPNFSSFMPGCRFHPLFLRGRRDLCHRMERVKVVNNHNNHNNHNKRTNNNGTKTTTTTTTQPAPPS